MDVKYKNNENQYKIKEIILRNLLSMSQEEKNDKKENLKAASGNQCALSREGQNRKTADFWLEIMQGST